jgi:hypothetical protein
MQTCTANGWYVSCTTPPGRLSVSRYPLLARDANYSRPAYGDADGKIFGDTDYTQFCLERGYLQPYVNSKVATFKRTHARDLRALWHSVTPSIKTATEYYELLEVAEFVKYIVTQYSRDTLIGVKWFNGCMAMARKLRPDLVIIR